MPPEPPGDLGAVEAVGAALGADEADEEVGALRAEADRRVRGVALEHELAEQRQLGRRRRRAQRELEGADAEVLVDRVRGARAAYSRAGSTVATSPWEPCAAAKAPVYFGQRRSADSSDGDRCTRCSRSARARGAEDGAAHEGGGAHRAVVGAADRVAHARVDPSRTCGGIGTAGAPPPARSSARSPPLGRVPTPSGPSRRAARRRRDSPPSGRAARRPRGADGGPLAPSTAIIVATSTAADDETPFPRTRASSRRCPSRRRHARHLVQQHRQHADVDGSAPSARASRRAASARRPPSAARPARSRRAARARPPPRRRRPRAPRRARASCSATHALGDHLQAASRCSRRSRP